MASRPIPMTGGKPGKHVHFSNYAQIQSFNPTQQPNRTFSTDSDDSDKTIRPKPSTTQPEHSSPETGGFNSSQTTAWSDGNSLSIRRPSISSSLESPLDPRSSGQGNETPSTQRDRSIGYGTVLPPLTQQGAMQQAQFTPHRYTAEYLEAERHIHVWWQSLWAWLCGTNTSTQSVDGSEPPPSEEPQHTIESDGSSSVHGSKRMINRFERLGSKTYELCSVARQSVTNYVTANPTKSLSCMLIVATVFLVVALIAYYLLGSK